MKKQSDGRYKSKVIVGTRQDGSKVVKYIAGATKRELEEERQRVLREYKNGLCSRDTRVLAMDWIYRWYDTVSAPKQKKEIAKHKRRTVDIYIAPYLADKQLRAVTAFDLQDIVNRCDKGHTIVSRIKSVLKGAFSSAYAQGVIERDVSVTLDAPLRPYEPRRALAESESATVEEILAERRTEPLLLSLLYYTGMRLGEVLGLQWRDVDFKRGVIRVERSLSFNTMTCGKPKTAAGVREIPMCEELREILMETPGIGENFIIQGARTGTALSESSFKLRFKRIKDAIGSEELTAHYFRHNYATRLYDAGVDALTAAKILGHSDPTTTLKIYTDIENSTRKQKSNEIAREAFKKK